MKTPNILLGSHSEYSDVANKSNLVFEGNMSQLVKYQETNNIHYLLSATDTFVIYLSDLFKLALWLL